MTKDTRTTYERITDAMIAAMETAAATDWVMPWHRMSVMPRNAYTDKEYQGMNIVMLWSAGYGSSDWATYKQWAELGAQVRKGEKGTLCVKWLSVEDKKAKAEGRKVMSNYMIPWGFVVFNAEQVDGYESKAIPLVDKTQSVAAADELIVRCGARINHGGDRAFFSPERDIVNVPPRVLFKETKTSTATEGYYATVMHELVHWTGAESRLKRKQSVSDMEAYAFEELVAELGSAFLCGRLGISNDPRPDHAQYLKGWLSRMKNDPSAIVKAASLAQKAVNYLLPPVKEPAAELTKEAA